MSELAMDPVSRAKARIKTLTGDEAAVPAAQTAEQPAETTQQGASLTASVPETTEQQHEPTSQKDDYKSKWLTLQGMHRSANEKVSRLEDQLQQALAKIDQLGQVQQQNALSASATPTEMAAHLATLQEDYGDTFTAAISGYVDGRMKALEQTVMQLMNQQVAGVKETASDATKIATQTRSDQFKANLSKIVPDWEGIYESNDFANWLDSSVEEMSGAPYSALFAQANNGWDLDRVAKFFINYKQATGRTTGSVNPAAAVDPRMNLVAPGNSSATGQPVPSAQQKPTYRWSDVQAFYKEVQTGRWKGREEEMNRLLADVNEANREGRIVN
jgi:hypothetical protein